MTLESCFKGKAEKDREHFPKELARMSGLPRIAGHVAGEDGYHGK